MKLEILFQNIGIIYETSVVKISKNIMFLLTHNFLKLGHLFELHCNYNFLVYLMVVSGLVAQQRSHTDDDRLVQFSSVLHTDQYSLHLHTCLSIQIRL